MIIKLKSYIFFLIFLIFSLIGILFYYFVKFFSKYLFYRSKIFYLLTNLIKLKLL